MLATDVVLACADLIGRAGALEFELGWTCPHVPDESDDHACPEITWWASVKWQGARLSRDNHPTPDGVCLALATHVLDGARCRCGEPVALADSAPGCRWQLAGQRWEPSCNVDPIRIQGPARRLARDGSSAQPRTTTPARPAEENLMGYVNVEVGGSFVGHYGIRSATEQFSAMQHGHADAVTRAIQYLAEVVLPRATALDHDLHANGAEPSGSFTPERITR